MQFSCESCKATLHIGDEKVKGKRLVVRCKKCGARIQIADPALGPPPAGAAPLSAAPAPAPAAKPVSGALSSKPGRKREHDSDTESTQAMDSGVLEQALRASKVDDSTMGDGLPQLATATHSRPPPPPEPPRDLPIWFAMIGGKQTGPLSRAELGLKVAQGQATGRTYLWKESMAGWQRAHDVAEVSALFGPPPSRPPVSLTLPPPVPTAASPKPRESGSFGEPKRDSSPGEERRGRQRQEPDFAKAGLDLSGIDLPLDIEAQKPAAKNPALQKSAPPPSNSSSSSLASSLFPAEREISRDPLSPTPEPDDDDRTHVEPLPLGERVHQEAVANELFSSSSESSPVASAKDLASWASQELGRRPTGPNQSKAPPVSISGKPGASPIPDSPGPTLGGAAQPGGADPFASVPNAPGFSAPDPVDTTGNIIARAGVKEKRTGRLVLLLGVLVLSLVGLVYALSYGGAMPAGDGQQEEKQSLGGTGESVDGLVKGTTSGATAAPTGEMAKLLAGNQPKRVATVANPAEKPKTDEASQDAAALAALDNTRGIGSHGPKANAVAATPDTAKSDTSLSADDIKKKLGENKGALQSCIDEALRKEPNLRVGKIHIATTIAPSGTVTSAKIDKKTVDDSALGACLKRATRRIIFPAFQGDEFEVDIPILVTAGD